jgi:hypothetical protein
MELASPLPIISGAAPHGLARAQHNGHELEHSIVHNVS